MVQAYYLAAPFAVERAPTISVGKRRRGVQVSYLKLHPDPFHITPSSRFDHAVTWPGGQAGALSRAWIGI